MCGSGYIISLNISKLRLKFGHRITKFVSVILQFLKMTKNDKQEPLQSKQIEFFQVIDVKRFLFLANLFIIPCGNWCSTMIILLFVGSLPTSVYLPLSFQFYIFCLIYIIKMFIYIHKHFHWLISLKPICLVINNKLLQQWINH